MTATVPSGGVNAAYQFVDGLNWSANSTYIVASRNYALNYTSPHQYKSAWEYLIAPAGAINTTMTSFVPDDFLPRP